MALEVLPPAFGKAHFYFGTVFQTLLGLVAELIEGADDECAAREVFALLKESATPPTSDG